MLNSDKIFTLALAASLTVHSAMLVRTPYFQAFLRKKIDRPIKISYVRNAPLPAEIEQKLIDQNNPWARPAQLKSLDKPNLPQPLKNRDAVLGKDKTLMAQEPALKPLTIKPDVISVKKKVTLPALDLAKMNNPTYIGYYQLVRERIRRAAYQNYSHTETGEVYLSFVISQQGLLRDVRLIEERSSSSHYLRDIAQRSVKNASPFPPFPRELNYPQLSFNVIISFEIE